jgi:hypothetical protein
MVTQQQSVTMPPTERYERKQPSAVGTQAHRAAGFMRVPLAACPPVRGPTTSDRVPLANHMVTQQQSVTLPPTECYERKQPSAVGTQAHRAAGFMRVPLAACPPWTGPRIRRGRSETRQARSTATKTRRASVIPRGQAGRFPPANQHFPCTGPYISCTRPVKYQYIPYSVLPLRLNSLDYSITRCGGRGFANVSRTVVVSGCVVLNWGAPRAHGPAESERLRVEEDFPP